MARFNTTVRQMTEMFKQKMIEMSQRKKNSWRRQKHTKSAFYCHATSYCHRFVSFAHDIAKMQYDTATWQRFRIPTCLPVESVTKPHQKNAVTVYAQQESIWLLFAVIHVTGRFTYTSLFNKKQPRTCKTHKTSGSDFWSGATGGRRQKTWCAGASDSICRSLGLFCNQGNGASW